MAGSVNKAIILGNLGKDPENKTFQDGNQVVNFSVATSETWKDKQTGERKEKTEWHNVTIRQQALCKVALDYLKKGSKVYIEGQIQTRKWQDKSGNDHYSTEIVIPAFGGALVLLGDKSGSGGAEGTASQEQASSKAASQTNLDDEIPF